MCHPPSVTAALRQRNKNKERPACVGRQMGCSVSPKGGGALRSQQKFVREEWWNSQTRFKQTERRRLAWPAWLARDTAASSSDRIRPWEIIHCHLQISLRSISATFPNTLASVILSECINHFSRDGRWSNAGFFFIIIILYSDLGHSEVNATPRKSNNFRLICMRKVQGNLL